MNGTRRPQTSHRCDASYAQNESLTIALLIDTKAIRNCRNSLKTNDGDHV